MPERNHFPCESCGSDLRFMPGQTQLVCPYCGHEQAIPAATAPSRTLALAEHNLTAALSDNLPADDMEDVRAASCPSCGAVVEFDGATHAKTCPFCATPVVVDTGNRRLIKPQALVPFVLTEAEAREAMVRWLGRLWFAPNGLVEYTRRGRALSGMYVPYWTFDADTASRYRGQRGIHYYETRTVTVNVNGRAERRQQQVRKTRWSPAAGSVARRFDDVAVLASTSLPQPFGDALDPWDLTALVPYEPGYLAGFRAEGYTVPLAEGHATARARMDGVIRSDVARDIGGDEQRIEAVDTRFTAETFKHVLLPIWSAAYKYNGRSFRFLVNGQTGEVQGERPWSAWKIAFAILIALLVFGAFAWVQQGGSLPSEIDWLGD